MRTANALIATAALTFASAAAAHHSSVPWYDLDAEPITISGVVTEFQFTNPHVFIFVDVTNGAGEVEQWRIEGTSRNRMIRAGWSENSIKVGQKVTATGFPARKGLGLDCEKLVVEDGVLVWER